MKLEIALKRLHARDLKLEAAIPRMTLFHVQCELTKLEGDLKAWQVIAHSKRANERWAAQKAPAITADALRDIDDSVLHKAAGKGGTAQVRALINAEIIRRAQERMAAAEADPFFGADDTLEDMLGGAPEENSPE
jgi:hypothetical protein